MKQFVSLGILITMFIIGPVCLAAEESKVVAVVGGEEITEDYLDYALRNVPQKYREGYEDQAGRLRCWKISSKCGSLPVQPRLKVSKRSQKSECSSKTERPGFSHQPMLSI